MQNHVKIIAILVLSKYIRGKLIIYFKKYNRIFVNHN